MQCKTIGDVLKRFSGLASLFPTILKLRWRYRSIHCWYPRSEIRHDVLESLVIRGMTTCGVGRIKQFETYRT